MRRFGVIFMDSIAIVLWIYEADNLHWKQIFTQQFPLTQATSTEIMETFSSLFSTDHAQHIAEWKICSRNSPKEIIFNISSAIGIPIEIITPEREQILLSKGMLSELW